MNVKKFRSNHFRKNTLKSVTIKEIILNIIHKLCRNIDIKRVIYPN